MSGLLSRLWSVTKAPGVPQARHLAERSLAPYVRDQVHRLGVDHGSTVERLASLELKVDLLLHQLQELDGRTQGIERYQPEVLNAISSSNGTARLVARRMFEVEREARRIDDRVDERVSEVLDRVGQVTDRVAAVEGHVEGVWDRMGHIGDDFRPHIGTIAFLLQRVETVRAEVMHEVRYGRDQHDTIEPKVINAAALAEPDLRINLGAGHLPLEGYVNIDIRELPGIDVVAGVDQLPFAAGSLAEISSSHTIEHFPELQLRRTLLPYWTGLLRSGGHFRAVVPDLEAMTQGLVDGTISFDVFRSVAYGGQEYEGDFHFTGFTPSSLARLLSEAGLAEVEVVASGRPNGDCLEFEMVATKP